MMESTTLAGSQKAAALLLAMGRPLAERVLRRFDEDDLRRLTQSIADFRAMPAGALDGLVDEFSARFAQGADLSGSADGARALLAAVLPPEKVADIMADALGAPKQSVWSRLADLPAATLARALAREHPQIAAYALDRLGSAIAARVLMTCDPPRRLDLARRLAASPAAAPAAARTLEGALEGELLAPAARGDVRPPEARLADIVVALDRREADELLATLEQDSAELAGKVRARLFNFEDVAALSSRARVVVFEKAPTDRVIMALKETDDVFRELVLSALGARARRMVEQELRDGQPAPRREIEAARRAIEQLVLELAGRGEIALGPEAGD